MIEDGVDNFDLIEVHGDHPSICVTIQLDDSTDMGMQNGWSPEQEANYGRWFP